MRYKIVAEGRNVKDMTQTVQHLYPESELKLENPGRSMIAMEIDGDIDDVRERILAILPGARIDRDGQYAQA